MQSLTRRWFQSEMNISTLLKQELNMNTDVGSWIWTEMLARTTACGLWGAEKHTARRMKHRVLGEILITKQTLTLVEDI